VKFIRKICLIITLFSLLLLLSGCNTGNRYYDEGYGKGFDAGYDAGYEDGLSDIDDELDLSSENCYDNGYFDGEHDAKDIWEDKIESAKDKARENSEWSVMEAVENIRAYQGGPIAEGFDRPTEAEYKESIETVILFCEYLGVSY